MLQRIEGEGADLKRDRVFQAILLDIICAELRPGSQVDEATLAQQYQAGRAGIRDALARLALEGLVERRPRLGTVITDLSLIDLQQVFELRAQLETHCVALAARNATQPEIEAILSAYDGVDDVVRAADYRTLVQMDQAFHGAIAVASRNPWLARALAPLQNSALRFWHFALPRRSIEKLREEIDFHRYIAEAIARRDAEAAQRAMRSVIGKFPDTMKEYLDASLHAWR